MFNARFNCCLPRFYNERNFDWQLLELINDIYWITMNFRNIKFLIEIVSTFICNIQYLYFHTLLFVSFVE